MFEDDDGLKQHADGIYIDTTEHDHVSVTRT